jgi:DNA topoisomerase VI subunit A
VLTIENLTTYQRYVREVSDAGIILYTGGFPAKSLLQFMKLLDDEATSAVSFYH